MDFLDRFVLNEDVVFVGEFLKKENNINLLSFDWKIDSATKYNKSGRVYFFVVISNEGNKDILKIGKSSDKKGLCGTIGCYVSALSGSPSVTRFSIHNLIRKKLDQNNRILVYVKFSKSIKTKLKGIFEEHESEIPLDMTYVEELCLKEYFKEYSKYPEWNYQESHKELPIDMIESYSSFVENKKNLKTK